MSIIGILIAIVLICIILQYVEMPPPLHTILTVVAIVLGVLLLVVVLQSLGVLPAFWGRPVRIE